MTTENSGNGANLFHTIIAGIVFLLVLTAGAVLSGVALRTIGDDIPAAGTDTPGNAAPGETSPGRSVSAQNYTGLLRGTWAAEFQNTYEDDLPITTPALHLWSTIRYRLFRAGTSGVAVGQEDWLFTTEELRVRHGDTAALRDSITTITDTVVDLQRHGAVVAIALVPAKARIYEDKLSGYPLPSAVSSRYGETVAALRTIPGAIVPDLRTPLLAARAVNSGRPVYLRRDTHWTPYGAAIVAEAIAEAVGSAEALGGDVPRTRFRTERTGTEAYSGDLLRFLPVGDAAADLGLVPEQVDRFTTEPVAASGGLFGDPVIPGVLVGTSYSAGTVWNFDGFLKDALELDFVNVAEEGQGPFAPMEAYLASDTISTYPPELVIWEIPERYLIDPAGRRSPVTRRGSAVYDVRLP